MSEGPSPDAVPVDASRVRWLFDRPRREPGDEFLQREVARRMLERLATVRLEVRRVVDLGCGAGADLAPLKQRFADAEVCGVDVVRSRLQEARPTPVRGFARWLPRMAGMPVVQADFGALPFPARSIDVLWSNLALHWTSAPHRLLPEWGRVVRAGGLVAFSAFGPDTLREVGAAFQAVDHRRHVLPFTDMHDYGDMLVEAGFTAPVVDMERLTLTYPHAASLWRDVRTLGGNALFDRARGLHGRVYGERVARALAAGRDAQGRFHLTFELIYAHAWKSEVRKTAAGESIVRFERDP